MKSKEKIQEEIDRLRDLYNTQKKSFDLSDFDGDIDGMIAELEEMRQTITLIGALEWVLRD